MIIDTLSKINCATLSPRASQICFLSFCSLRMPGVGVGCKESFCTHICEFSAHKILSHVHPFILPQGDLGLDINYEAYTSYGAISYFRS